MAIQTLAKNNVSITDLCARPIKPKVDNFEITTGKSQK